MPSGRRRDLFLDASPQNGTRPALGEYASFRPVAPATKNGTAPATPTARGFVAISLWYVAPVTSFREAIGRWWSRLYVGLVGPSARRRSVWGTVSTLLILLSVTWAHSADARRLVVRGRFGPIVQRSISGNAFLGVFPRQGIFFRRGGRVFGAGRIPRRFLLPQPAVGAAGLPFQIAASPIPNPRNALFDEFGRADALGGRISNIGGVFAGLGFPNPGEGPVAFPGGASSPGPLDGNPLVPNGCGVVVNGPGGHGGAGLCRDPIPGQNPFSASRPVAPVFPAIGADGSLTPKACRNLSAAICGGRNAVDEERRVFAEGRRVVNAYIAAADANRSIGTVFANVLRNPGRFLRQYTEYLDFVSSEAGAFDAVAGRTLERVRDAIDGTAFPPNVKDAMKTKLEGVSMRMTPDADVASLRMFVAQCGADGMAASAFAVPERKEIVVCPGMALRAKALGGDLMSNLMHVLAHECGHNCGADKFPTGGQSEFRAQFQSYGACLKRRHPAFDPNAMLGEAVADALGYAAVAQEIRGRSPEAAFEFLRRAVSPLCGTKGDGVHPDGDFRINVLLGENPQILETLQCAVPADVCKLEGGK